jgi:glycosyltransferase involved in cell wall biosynthesis
MSRVSVVMITHNRRDEALRTLEAMTSLPDAAPIVVADNASTDGTADAVADLFPNVSLLRCDRNLGALARNLAVRQIQTPYVAFCDDDTRWQPGALTRAVELLDTYPGLASVTGRCLVEPDLREDPITPELRDSPVRGPDWLPGPALLGVLAGGFSPRMWLGGEEELLALDLAAHGWWMCWDPDIVIHHAPSQARDARRRRQLGIRNTLWTMWLRRPVRSAARRTVDVLRSAPRDLATVAAVAEALRGLPWVLAERRVVPPSVEEGLRSLEESQRHSTARRYVG